MKSCENCRNYSALDKDKYEYDFENACCGGDEKHEGCEYYEIAKEIVDTEKEIKKIYNNRLEAEAADIQPVKRGKWDNEYLDDDIWWAECTACKEETHSRYGRVSAYNYCPNCGADMREHKAIKG